MNNCILTLSVGKDFSELASLTHKSIKNYAKKVNADFIEIKESSCSTPHWQKLIEIKKLLEKYDKVLYLDTDIIIREDCPNLFEMTDDLAMFNEAPFTDRSKELLIDTCKEYGVQTDWDGRYFNTGVMLIPKKYANLFNKPEKEYFSYYEQTYLNMIFAVNKPQITELPHYFNRMTCMDKITGEERHASYIIHYAGCPNIEILKDLIVKDLKKWENDKKTNHEYKRHILVKVGGGLGDQICAEPAIRFMIENLYKKDDVTIVTHWKEIFTHLKVKVFTYDEFKPEFDTPYFEIDSLPGPSSRNWAICSHLLCHPVDYASMAILHRTLPIKDKTPKLVFSKKDLNKVKEMTKGMKKIILIHPGRHWKTKTFPVKWWNEVISKASKLGNVCIIGKDEGDRGTLDIDVKNVTDFRDKLSLTELFAMISIADTLITNDSAPVHIAGAFDTNIILIPSCKHPDHLLHFRNGSQYYKSKALYKKLLIDEVISHPSHVYQTSADFEVKNWNKYLPTPDEVVKAI